MAEKAIWAQKSTTKELARAISSIKVAETLKTNPIQTVEQVRAKTSRPKRVKGEQVMTVPQSNNTQVGARLLQYSPKWQVTDTWVRKVVEKGLRLPFARNAPTLERTTVDSGRSPTVMNAIQEFLEKGALEPATTKGFTMRLFVDERGEKSRPILDCRPLNRYMQPRHFKMEDLRMLAAIVQPGDYTRPQRCEYIGRSSQRAVGCPETEIYYIKRCPTPGPN